MAFSDSAYDVILNGKGYMLARKSADGTGPRRWSVESVGAAITQQLPEEGRYGNQQPTIEVPMVWTGGDLGYGDKERRSERRYHYSTDIDARFPERVIPGPQVISLTGTTAGAVNAFFEQNDTLFVLGGRYCYYIKSDDTFAVSKDFGSGKVAWSATRWGTGAYIGLGYGNPFWQRAYNADPTAGWTQGNNPIGYSVAHKDSLWASVGAYSVASVAANPMVWGDWSAAYTIGDPGSSITSMGSSADIVYIGKTDGLHALDNSGDAPCLTPELRAYPDAANCANMRSWHGLWLVPHIRGFYSYQELGDSGFRITPLGPNHDLDVDNPIRGRITAMVGDDRWLYAAIWNGTTAYILAGREAKEEEQKYGPMIWHPLCTAGDAAVGAMHISTLRSYPALWFASGTTIKYFKLPVYSDDPQTDTTYTYASSGSIYLSFQNWQSPATAKVFKSLEIETDNASTFTGLSVYYKIDQDKTWTSAGRVTSSPRASLPIAEAGIIGVGIRVRIDYWTRGGSTPVVLRRVVCRAIERPRQVDVISMVVRCGNDVTLRNRVRCPRTGAQMLAELKGLAQDNIGVVPLVDIVGSQRDVVVLPPVSEAEAAQDGELAREIYATVRMAVVQVAEPVFTLVRLPISGAEYEGIIIPLELPTHVGKHVADDYFSINIAGTSSVQGIFTVAGPITDLRIENTTTGDVLSLSGTTIDDGDWYKFDSFSRYKTVVDSNGTNQIGKLAAGSNLDSFTLMPGKNIIHITGTATAQNTEGTLEYLPKDV